MEVELVRQGHTLFVRSAFRLWEEVEGVRQELREVKGESKVEERRSLHEHVDDMDDKHKTHYLSHGECARCDTVLTNEKKRYNARSHSDIVEVSENGHIVIGVRIMQCYHAIMANVHFSSFGPNFILVPSSTCSQFQLVVRLFD